MTINRESFEKQHRGQLPLRFVRQHPSYHWFVVGTVCVGAFMAALDASIINIALPVLKKDFHVHMYIIEWVSLVYLLALAGLIVPFGRLADMVGRRWMYAFGFVVFGIGSLFCGLADRLTILLVARGIQAIGAAMLQANSVAIITAATPANHRGKAIGIQASAQGIGLSLGPAVGGAILSLLSWKWIFFVNLPVSVIGTVLGVLILPRDANSRTAIAAGSPRERFDFLGAACLIPALVSLIYVLNMGFKVGWASHWVVIAYMVFVIGMTLFLYTERAVQNPLVDLTLFRSPTFSLGSVTGILSFAVMYAVLLLGPFYLNDVQRLNAFHAGLYLTIVPIGMTVITPIAGAVADKMGTRGPTALGMCMACLGCVLLALMGMHMSFGLVFGGLLLVGFGLGLFTPPNNSSVMGSAPSNRLGVAGGILNMSRTLGMGLGITLGGLSYQLFLAHAGVTNEAIASVENMVHAFRWSFVVIGTIALLTMGLSMGRRGT